MQKGIIVLLFLLYSNLTVFAQHLTDSNNINKILNTKFTAKVTSKMEVYQKRILSKTEKTLTKLSRWESKIHTILQKANPGTAEKLFGNNQITFTSLLLKIREGEAIAENYKGQYDEYMDNLSTGIKYLQKQEESIATGKSLLKNVDEQAKALQENLTQSEYIKTFIKERKKLLFEEAVKYIGNSKYFSKINKESYYYTTTLKNYKDIFSDESKAEAAVKEALAKIPAFQKFMQQNSQLASLFRIQGSSSDANVDQSQSLAGLQTRSSVQQIIQERIASGGPGAQAQVQQNLAAAQVEMNQLKDKINQFTRGGRSDEEIPDFKPNEQKSKTLWQRLEYGFDVQFAKNQAWMPSTGDIAGSLGYKISDKSIVGFGMSYKLGIGSIERIRITSEGMGLRSYLDWKAPFGSKWGILSNLWISGGYEMNYNSGFKKIEQLKEFDAWQRSALIGISKKYKISKRMKGEMKLLYDLMAQKHIPVSQSVIFRLGYKF